MSDENQITKSKIQNLSENFAFTLNLCFANLSVSSAHIWCYRLQKLQKINKIKWKKWKWEVKIEKLTSRLGWWKEDKRKKELFKEEMQKPEKNQQKDKREHKRRKKTEGEGRRRKAKREKTPRTAGKEEKEKWRKKEVYSTSPSGGNQVDGLPTVQHRVESNRLKLFDSKSNTERVVIQIRGAQRTCMTNDISFSIW